MGTDLFDEHLVDYNNLKNIVIALSNKGEGDDKKIDTQIIQQGPSISTKDMNAIKELLEKFPELEALLKKLQKEFSDHMLNYKSFTDDTNKKIDNTNNDLKHFKGDTNKKIKELEDLIKSLKDKIDNLDLSSLGSKGSSGEVSGEISLQIKKILARLDQHGDKLNAHDTQFDDLRRELERLKDRVNGLDGFTNENRNRIIALEEEVGELRGLKSRIDILEQLFRELKEKQSKGGSRKHSVDVSNMGGVNLDQVQKMIDDAINKLRDEIMAIIDELRALIDKKADSDDLWKSEAALLEKLDQVAGALMKRAQADKSDTKKALIFLEKKIKEISIYLFGDPSQAEEGAIFAKKPWNPWSCASCDNRLNNYPGPLIDYKSWNKLP